MRKITVEKRPQRTITVARGGVPKRDSGDKLKDLHDAGAERHPAAWLAANQAAISAALACGFDYTTPANKLLLSLVVLRVLDKVMPDDAELLGKRNA